jgi:predicted HicB family RNase H-like nuclease
MLRYKDYTAAIYYMPRVSSFYGEVVNNRDNIIFLAEYKQDLEQVFKIAVDQYLAFGK